MARNKYLNNRDLLLEIHKSKKKYSSYISDEDSDFDVIVPELKKINIRSVAEARRNRVKKMEKATGEKKEDIMDVAPSEVVKTMQESSVDLLIHGHTHRPNTHKIEVNNKPVRRIVLGDWDQYGWYIWMDSRSCELKKFSIS